VIQSRGLSYRHPGGALLRFPDVDVPQGAVLLLGGPSGSGKSTWLALAGALVRPAAGALLVAGQALHTLAPVAADAWRARAVGFLPQRLHLSPALTVAENLALAFWATGAVLDRTRIQRCLEALGIANLAHRKPGQLSGGQAQRAALARAVLQGPQVLLADEPTASLDDAAAADAVALLESTSRSQGATLVIATHDTRVAALLQPIVFGENGIQAMPIERMMLSKQEYFPGPDALACEGVGR